jgi:protein-arginine kinase activator protein McsA
MKITDLFDFLFNSNDDPNFKSYDSIEKSIKEKASEGKVIKTEYEENGLKVTREEYVSDDGKTSWSRTTYEELDHTKEINALKKELNEAIEAQNFEKAAELRDKIKEKSSKK